MASELTRQTTDRPMIDSLNERLDAAIWAAGTANDAASSAQATADAAAQGVKGCLDAIDSQELTTADQAWPAASQQWLRGC